MACVFASLFYNVYTDMPCEFLWYGRENRTVVWKGKRSGVGKETRGVFRRRGREEVHIATGEKLGTW